MKKHFVKIFWEADNGTLYGYEGLIYGTERNGRVTISPSKLFRNLFGFDFPGGCISLH